MQACSIKKGSEKDNSVGQRRMAQKRGSRQKGDTAWTETGMKGVKREKGRRHLCFFGNGQESDRAFGLIANSKIEIENRGRESEIEI